MKRESTILTECLVAAGAAGGRVFRNNVGLTPPIPPDGRRVRYGLAPGSADLIGWVPVEVAPGRAVAVFVSIECKTRRGTVRPDQQHWLDQVRAAGGIALVARCPEDVTRALIQDTSL